MTRPRYGPADPWPPDRPGGRRVGLQYRLVLGGDQRIRPDQVPGLAGIADRDQVGVRPGGPFRCQPQHLRTESGQHHAAARNAVGDERVEIPHERVVRPVVLPGRLAMTGADAEQEPARVGRLDPAEGRGDLVRIAVPHVHDPCRHDQRAGRAEQLVNDREVAARRAAEPQCPEAELFQARGQRRRHLRDATPHAEPAEVLPPVLSHRGCPRASIACSCPRLSLPAADTVSPLGLPIA